MLIEAVVLSILIGWIRGGRLGRLRQIREKTLWFLVAGVLLQSLLVFSNNFIGRTFVDKFLTYSREIILFSFILIAIGIIINYKIRPLWISFIGFVMNFLVMFSNAWKRPILLAGMELTGQGELLNIIGETSLSIFTPLVETSKYPLLSNIVVFAEPYPLAKLVSLGDIMVAIGLFIFIQDIMFKSNSFFKR